MVNYNKWFPPKWSRKLAEDIKSKFPVIVAGKEKHKLNFFHLHETDKPVCADRGMFGQPIKKCNNEAIWWYPYSKSSYCNDHIGTIKYWYVLRWQALRYEMFLFNFYPEYVSHPPFRNVV